MKGRKEEGGEKGKSGECKVGGDKDRRLEERKK